MTAIQQYRAFSKYVETKTLMAVPEDMDRKAC